MSSAGKEVGTNVWGAIFVFSTRVHMKHTGKITMSKCHIFKAKSCFFHLHFHCVTVHQKQVSLFLQISNRGFCYFVLGENYSFSTLCGGKK